MAGLAWTIVTVLVVVLATDYGWSCYRDWRSRRRAVRHGRTLTQKFSLLAD
jgi:hypothetical protein